MKRMDKEDLQQTRLCLCSEGHRRSGAGRKRALQSGAEEHNLCRAIWLWSALHQTDKREGGNTSQASQWQVPERDLQVNWKGLRLEVPDQPVYKMKCQMVATRTHKPMHKDMGSVTQTEA